MAVLGLIRINPAWGFWVAGVLHLGFSLTLDPRLLNLPRWGIWYLAIDEVCLLVVKLGHATIS